jgi:hypothetical protein
MRTFINQGYLLSLLVVIFFLNSCGSPSRQEKSDRQETILDSADLQIRFKNLVFCLPSPHRVTKYFIDNQMDFESELALAPTANPSYLTNFEKALHVGIYGTNQGYQVLFDKDHDSLSLFLKVKDLINSLGLLDAVNQESLLKIEKRNFSPDTILYFISNSYREVNTFAQSQNKQGLSALIIAGGWVESFYLLTEMQARNQNKNLGYMIVEHKSALDNLIKILGPYYDSNPQYKELIDKLVDLAYDLDAVEFEYQYLPPVTLEEEMLTIVKSSSKVDFSIDQLERLTAKIKSIRHFIIYQT